MKIKEIQTDIVGAALRKVVLERVVEIGNKEPVPAGAVKVPDETEIYDWKEVTK
jgi:hypothetical protein